MIHAMYQALEGTDVRKTGPAFVLVTGPWGAAMQATVGFPVVPGTKTESVPAGYTLESLPSSPALAMVHQGARNTLAAADTPLFAKAGRAIADGGTRMYVLLDRPDEAGPAGPKTKAVLLLSE